MSGRPTKKRPDRRRSELAQIHIARRDLGMDDATYRAMLISVVQTDSAKTLDEEGRRRVLDHLKSHGWRPTKPRRDSARPRILRGRGSRGRMLRKIEAFLAEANRPWSYALAILKRQGGPDRLEWAVGGQLAGVIAALDRDAARHGRRRG